MKEKSGAPAQKAAKRPRRPPLEPITYDELLSNAGMSGFVSFLDLPPLKQATEIESTAPPAEIPQRKTQPWFWSDRWPKRKTPPPAEPGVRPAGRYRICPLRSARDGHSWADQAVYDALWTAAVPDPEAPHTRLVAIPYQALVKTTQLSRVSVKAAVHSLEDKLSIETVVQANTRGAPLTSKTYRIYPEDEIVKRREAAGFKWGKRSRGIKLLRHSELDDYVRKS